MIRTSWDHPTTRRIAPAFLVAILVMAGFGPGWAAASAADQAVSRDEAVAIASATLPGGSLEGVRLYVFPRLLPAGETVSTWRSDLFVTPAPGWFVFVDPYPGANWEHRCLYLFIDAATGAIVRHEAMIPPRLQAELIEITHGHDNPPPGVSERVLADFRDRLRGLPKPEPSRGGAYAFITSGGANQGNNHIRYWNDCSFIYSVLTEYYGYEDDHIRVCISDGTNPAPDRSDGTNSPTDLDGDGDADIEYPATRTYIGQVFNELAQTLTPSDQLFIFTTDHGGQESGWNCYLNLWNWETLRDDELAVYVNALPCETILCTFEQCFSGGMIDDLQGDGRVIATACRWDEYSWAMGPNYIYDEFVYYWTSAVGWADPYGNPVDADTDNDGLVSMREAFVYADAHDTAGETPQYSSTPADLGEHLYLDLPTKVWLVLADGSGDAPTIQAAIDSAAAIDTVLIADGTFTGPGNQDITFRGKPITVRSLNGPETCVIDCAIDRTSPHRGFSFYSGEDEQSVLKGVTITGGDVWAPLGHGGGIWCLNSSPKIIDCRIVGNSAATGGGGIYSDNASPRLVRCLITGNRSAGDGGGIFCAGAATPDIVGCTISGNWADGEGGGLYGACSPEATIIWDNCADAGLADEWFGDGGAFVICCNDIDASGLYGFDTRISMCHPGAINLNQDPMFCDPMACDTAPTRAGNYGLADGSHCAAHYNPCGIQIGALGEACTGQAVGDEVQPPLQAMLSLSRSPAAGRVVMSWAVPEARAVGIFIHDVSGHRVRSYRFDTAHGTLTWDGTDAAGQSVASGVYFVRLVAGAADVTRQVLLVH